MNRDRIIKWTAAVAVLSIVLLLYWVFAFVSIVVFEFKIFKENLTQSFYLSILGILSLLGGSLIVNVIFNLSKIADSLSAAGSQEHPLAPRYRPLHFALFLLSFPALLGVLYLGDLASSANRQRLLLETARYMIEQNPKDIEVLGAYSFDAGYVRRVSERLELLGNSNESFPNISVVVSDSIGPRRVLLEFKRYGAWPEKGSASRSHFIHSCSTEENEYLKSVFEGQETRHRFGAVGGSYELYYPVRTPSRTIVIRFTEYGEYGKYGS